MPTTEHRPVCDYEGSDYRTRFWEDQGRDYEDLVERVALRRLMPPRGETLIDIGAGFGRLADEYDGYQQVVLFDYSRSLLREARQRMGGDPRFLYVAGNWYQMPFVDGLFETMVQVRTVHHAADVPGLLTQLARIARPRAQYVLEFANKRNLKAILRYVLRRQKWSPFQPQPIEFAELNYDFHPRWIRRQLQAAGFSPGETLAVSHFRLNFLKRNVPTSWLVATDRMLQRTGRWCQLTPSVFQASRNVSSGPVAGEDQFFACPHCQTPLAAPTREILTCPGCQRRWSVDRGIFDFKEPLTS